LNLKVDVIDADADDEVINQINIHGDPKDIELLKKMYNKVIRNYFSTRTILCSAM
jgi:hypothetical protein